MDNERSSSEKRDWIEPLLKVASTTATSIGKNFVEKMQKKIERTIASVVRNVLVLFLVLMGLIFLMVGLAQGIGDYFGIGSALGYMIVGAVAVIIAGLVNWAKKA